MNKLDFEIELARACDQMCPELELMYAVTENLDGSFMTHVARRQDACLLPGRPIYIAHLTEDQLRQIARADVAYRIIAHGWTRDPFYDRRDKPDTLEMPAPKFDTDRAPPDYVAFEVIR